MFRKISILLLSAVATAAIGQVSISQLPPATLPLKPTDQIIVNQTISGHASTRQASLSAIDGGLTSHFVLQAADPTLSQSRVLAGTPNQVILTDGGALGNLTLSLPQSIGTGNSPTFAGLTVSGNITAGSGTFIGTLSSGGYTGTTGTFSGALSSVGYSGTTGTFTGALSAASLSLTSPLPATSGGTGQSGYAIGDLLAADSTITLSRLPDVSVGSYLRSGGVNTLPLWSTLKLPNSAVQGDLFFASSANTMGNLADVSSGAYLRSGGIGANPVWSTVTLPNAAVLGDIWYSSASQAISALAGNTTTAKQFLTQTGTGAVSAAPAWGTIAAGDLPGSFSGFANPTGTIGLAVVNGSATTAMRSDGHPALDQSIAPTWTGAHAWNFSGTGSVISVTNSASQTVPAAKISSTFTATATPPLLSLISTATTPFATFSLSANGTVGTDDFAIFQNGASNRDTTLLNRATAGALILGSGGSNRITIASGGGVSVAAPSSGSVLTLSPITSSSVVISMPR